MNPKNVGGDRDPQFGKSVCEARPHACGYWLAQETTVCVHSSGVIEHECILKSDDVAFHALHLGDVGDAACAVAKP